MRLVGEINRLVKNAEKLQPKENVFFEKEGMQASLVVPEKNTQRWTKEGKLPLVVVVHGLSAHSRQSLIRQIAGLHEELGLPVMRLNFQDKPERMFPIHEKAAFLSEALEKALTNSRIDASRVELIGQSQGGLVVRSAFDRIKKMTRRPFVITISTPPHMRLYNECLLNSKRLVFKDAPEGLIESLLLSPEEAEKDFLTGDVKQLHITHPGDNVVPIELYREHVKKSQLRMLPEFVSEKEVGDKISRKIALTKQALDLAGVTDPRDRIPRLSGLVGGLFADWAEGTIRKGKNREKIPEALRVLRKAQRLEDKAIGADRTRRDVAAAWFWDFIMSHPLHNWTVPEDRSALLKLLGRETAKYAA